jgi:hypothetical protein
VAEDGNAEIAALMGWSEVRWDGKTRLGCTWDERLDSIGFNWIRRAVEREVVD